MAATYAADTISTSKPGQKSVIRNTFLYSGEDRVCVSFASKHNDVDEAKTMKVVKPKEYEGETFEYDFAPEPFTYEGLIVHLKGE